MNASRDGESAIYYRKHDNSVMWNHWIAYRAAEQAPYDWKHSTEHSVA